MRRAAIHLSILTIFAVPWEAAVVLSGVGTVSRLIGAAAGALWLLTVLSTGGVRRPTGFHLAAGAFFLWNVASQLWTIDPDLTLERAGAYARMAALTLMIWDLFRTRAEIRAGLQAYVLGTIVPIASTILNYLQGVQSEWGRYSGTGDNANTTGIVIALGIPLAMRLATDGARNSRGRWAWQVLNYAVVAFGLFAIGLTATRFAAFMTLPAFLFALSAWSRMKRSSRVLLALVLVGGLLAIPRLLPEVSVQRLGNAVEDATAGDLTGRTIIWDHAIDVWLEHPLLGVGSNGFRRAVELELGRARDPHNSFLSVLADTGIVGFALLMLVLLVSVSRAARQPGLDGRFWLTVLAVLGLGNLAITFVHVKATWLLLSLNVASAGDRVSRHSGLEAASPRAPAASPTVRAGSTRPLAG